MRQRWRDLLFLHWDWDPNHVQKTLPAGLTVDTWNGRAYLGVVPFFMEGVRPTGLPPVPWLSSFLELNVRTYVRDSQGRPGVWFYSLDCNQPVAVQIARTFFHLPYFHARMRARREGQRIFYQSQRGQWKASQFFYAPAGPSAPALAGSLEEFLVERYRLFASDGHRILSGSVWHPPYEFAEATHDGEISPPLLAAGFDPDAAPPAHAIYSPGVDVRIFPMSRG